MPRVGRARAGAGLDGFAVEGGGVFAAAAVETGLAGELGAAFDIGAESGFSSSVHSIVEGLSSIVTERLAGEKPNISTWSFHTPAARLLKVYWPASSVVVAIFCSPCVAITVAPGIASPPDRTIPFC